MQTNLLLDDSQMNKLSNEESQKVYKEMVKQNRLDQNAAKEDREKAEKAQQETKAQVASLTSQLQQLSQQINDMQTNRNGNRNLMLVVRVKRLMSRHRQLLISLMLMR